MPKYLVTDGPVEHDGKPHATGDELTLTAEQAEGLVAAGIVEPTGKAKAAPAPAPAQAEG